MKSIGYDAVLDMNFQEREWFVRRLYNQLKKEHDDIEKAKRKK
jgi:hypothetical protein